jgi:formylglycine-generating enzyme
MIAHGVGALVVGTFILVAPSFAVTIPTVPVGNPGNPADMRYSDSDHPNGVGAVGNSFRMAKTEVTNAQYVAFLNAVAATDTYGLFDTQMGRDTRGGIVRNSTFGDFTYSVKTPALGGFPARMSGTKQLTTRTTA